MSQTEIATHIGVNKSTMSRELRHNTLSSGYTAGRYIVEHPQRKTNQRYSSKPKQILLDNDLKKD